MKSIPKRLDRAIARMPGDTPTSVVETIERAGFVIVPRSALVELGRGWRDFLDDDKGASLDRLAPAVLRVLVAEREARR